MTKVSGGAAFIRLKEPKNDIPQTMQYWGGLAHKENEAQKKRDFDEEEAEKGRQHQNAAAKKLADERGGVRKAQATEKWQKEYGFDPAEFKNMVTGWSTYDDSGRNFALNMTDKYNETYRLAEEARKNGDTQTQRQHEAMLMKYKQSFREVSSLQPILADKYKKYQEAVKAGKVSGVSAEYEKQMESIFKDKNVAIRTNKNGNPVMIGITPEVAKSMGVKTDTSMDEDGDGLFEIPFSDVMNGSWDWTPKADEKGIIKNTLVNLGKYTKKYYKGYTNILEQKWDAKIHGQATRDAIDLELGDDRVMADLYHRLVDKSSTQIEGFNEDQRAKVAEVLYNGVYAGYSQKDERSKNNSAYATDSAARQRGLDRAAKKANGKKEDAKYSRLHYDAIKTEEGDYEGYIGVYTDDKGKDRTVTDIIERTDGKLSLMDSSGKLLKVVPKGRRAFLEHKLKNNKEYGKITPEQVLDYPAMQYRDTTTEGAPYETLTNSLYDEKGELLSDYSGTWDDIEVLNRIYSTIGLRGEDEITTFGNSINIKVKGKPEIVIDTTKKENLDKGLHTAEQYVKSSNKKGKYN